MFKLGKRSRDRLAGVHPALVAAVKHAITVTECDFTMLEGVRTGARQAELHAAGASQLNGVGRRRSKHQVDPVTGYGHAVDLAAWVGGTVRWEFQLYYQIAESMALAANTLDLRIRWGGCWEVLNADGADTAATLKRKVDDYVARKRSIGRRAFLDGPHFELYGKAPKGW